MLATVIDRRAGSGVAPSTRWAGVPRAVGRYRADIDGLRAVAVLLVVLDHLQTRVHGGYVGVDVFFVISGYLISGTVLKEMDEGRFSIASFYERRIRRIFPALLVMLIGASFLVVRFCVPSEIDEFGRTMVGALLSITNFIFWHQAGYFDAPSASKPLLHTWSLAVEEQFYLFFPLFLMAVRRWWPHRLRSAICGVAALSFVLAWVCVRRDMAAAFFFSPLRAWELLLGTIVSQRYLPAILGQTARNAAAGVGLVLIVVPGFWYSSATMFPGASALLPCAGAALVIAAGETGGSVVASLLGWSPVAFVGLISYSLYLWHWPILVFQRTSYLLVDANLGSREAKGAVFVASMAAAVVSWAFVERPFRKGRLRPGRRRLFVVNGALAALLVGLGLAMSASRGFPGRFPAMALEVDGYTKYRAAADFREGRCFLNHGESFAAFDRGLCLAEDAGSAGRPQELLLGDSHAAHLYQGLLRVFPGMNVSQATAAGCLPVLEQAKGRGTCADLMRWVFEDYLVSRRPAAVLLSAHWGETDVGALSETIGWLKSHGQNVILFGPNPEFNEPLPRLLALALRDAHPESVARHWDGNVPELDKRLRELARDRWGVRYVSAFADLCSPQRVGAETAGGCPEYAGSGVPLLFDTDHLTVEASVMYARAIRARGELDLARSSADEVLTVPRGGLESWGLDNIGRGRKMPAVFSEEGTDGSAVDRLPLLGSP